MSDRRAIPDDELLPEYSLRGGVRGTYAARHDEGTNVVLLDADVAELFPNSESVNQALRKLTELRRNAGG
jgi:hypothetical protein